MFSVSTTKKPLIQQKLHYPRYIIGAVVRKKKEPDALKVLKEVYSTKPFSK